MTMEMGMVMAGDGNGDGDGDGDGDGMGMSVGIDVGIDVGMGVGMGMGMRMGWDRMGWDGMGMEMFDGTDVCIRLTERDIVIKTSDEAVSYLREQLEKVMEKHECAIESSYTVNSASLKDMRPSLQEFLKKITETA